MKFENYTKMHELCKTVTLGLKPEGETAENLKKYEKGLRDEERKIMYPKAKDILDELHLQLLTKGLEKCRETLDFAPYVDTLEGLTDKKDIINLNREFLPKIVKVITSVPGYEELFDAAIFSPKKEVPFDISKENRDILGIYYGFSSYFTEFNTIRRAVYENVGLKGSVTGRIQENAEIFNRNRSKILALGPYQQTFDKVTASAPLTNEYADVLTQKGIDAYNTAIGKLNQAFNEFRSQAPKETQPRIMKLEPLMKQLLSRREPLVIQYQSDNAVIKALKELDTEEYFRKAEEYLAYLEEKKENTFGSILIKKGKLPEYSQLSGHRWDTIMSAVRTRMDETSSSIEQLLSGEQKEAKKTSKKKKELTNDELEEKLRKADVSVAFIDESLERESVTGGRFNTITSYIAYARTVIGIAKSAVKDLNEYLASRTGDKPLKEDGIEIISGTVKKLVSVNRLAKVFSTEGSEDEFSILIKAFLDAAWEMDSTYNKCRNYLTGKPYSNEKQRMYFANPTLGGGWSNKNDRQNELVMLRKNNTYYIGIKNPLLKGNWLPLSNDGEGYEKMEYHYIPDFGKNFPHATIQLKEAKKAFEAGEPIFVADSSSFIKPFQITKEMKDLSDSEYGCPKYKIKYLRSGGDEKVYREAVKKWIQFGYDFLKSYRTAQCFDIDSLLPLNRFESVEDFYLAVERLGYKLSFDGGIVKEEDMKKAVREGYIFLFRISNRYLDELPEKPDIRKSLFTQYFLDAVNGKDGTRLNGGVAIFYRKPSLTYAYTHKEGDILINKFTKDGEKIPGDIYVPILRYLNGQTTTLTEKQKEWLPRLVTKEATKAIIKDERYTKDHYEVQIPITLNALEDTNSVTERARKELGESKQYNTLALYRGKQNLFTYAVLNEKNETLETGNFDSPTGIPYKKVLYTMEQERISKIRDEWDASVKTKEVIDGYLTAIVGEVTKLVLKYNAILCVENPESKRKGIRIEDRAYSRLVQMLANKLSYIKKDGKGIQLAGTGSYFIQNGALLEVAAAYCDSTDPTTGFVSAFNFERITRIAQKKEFFDRFDSIIYDGKDFLFTFDYTKGFDTYFIPAKTQWTVTTHGTRLEYNPAEKKNNSIKISEELSEFLKEQGISLKDDILLQLKDVSGETVNGALWNNLFRLFRLALRSQQIDFRTGAEDFVSPTTGNVLPYAADVVGSINLARKGLCIISKIRKSDNPGKEELLITQEEFFALPTITK